MKKIKKLNDLIGFLQYLQTLNRTKVDIDTILKDLIAINNELLNKK